MSYLDTVYNKLMLYLNMVDTGYDKYLKHCFKLAIWSSGHTIYISNSIGIIEPVKYAINKLIE